MSRTSLRATSITTLQIETVDDNTVEVRKLKVIFHNGENLNLVELSRG